SVVWRKLILGLSGGGERGGESKFKSGLSPSTPLVKGTIFEFILNLIKSLETLEEVVLVVITSIGLKSTALSPISRFSLIFLLASSTLVSILTPSAEIDCYDEEGKKCRPISKVGAKGKNRERHTCAE